MATTLIQINMKIKKMITFAILIGLFSCGQQHTKSIENNITKSDSVVIQTKPTFDKEMTINNKRIDWTKFDKVYAHIDNKNEFKQIIGVNWHGVDSIDYQLICSSMLCDMELHGTAKANHPDCDNEIDEDENGGYPVDEFLFETNDYVVSVRIDSKTKLKARLIYSPKGDVDEDCDPNSELIMKILNAH
jgi:hypothetical protein